MEKSMKKLFPVSYQIILINRLTPYEGACMDGMAGISKILQLDFKTGYIFRNIDFLVM